jgi:hypothetical protein
MNGPTADVSIQPNYNAAAQSYTDYDNKAIVSLDSLFRPLSTVPKSGWPSFEQPQNSGSGEINSLSLNPTQKGHDFNVLSVGNNFEDGGLLPIDYSGVPEESGFIPARLMGIRLPAIGVGWGYTTDGTPTPSGTGENGFAPDYLYNSTNWKAGPIDLRWDEERKVWGTGGGSIDMVQFRPMDVCAGIGFTCDCVTAEVFNVPCNSTYNEGDIIQVWDRSRGWFEMPEELLFNSVGWAIKTKVSPEEAASLPGDIGPCRWVVISMDCIEQEPLE